MGKQLDIKGRYLKGKFCTLIVMDGFGPVEINYENVDNKEGIQNVIDSLKNGDLVKINCSPVQEFITIMLLEKNIKKEYNNI